MCTAIADWRTWLDGCYVKIDDIMMGRMFWLKRVKGGVTLQAKTTMAVGTWSDMRLFLHKKPSSDIPSKIIHIPHSSS